MLTQLGAYLVPSQAISEDNGFIADYWQQHPTKDRNLAIMGDRVHWCKLVITNVYGHINLLIEKRGLNESHFPT